MGIEGIEGKPGLQEKAPWKCSKKTLKKNRPSSSVTSNRATLTRFLGPSGPPLAQWEDINRECPVCQRKGFSSRGLEVHVNECLDVRLSRGDSNSGVREHSKLEASSKAQVEDASPGRKTTAADFGSRKVAKMKRAPAAAEHTIKEGVDVEAKSNAPTEKRVDGAIASPTVCSDKSNKRPKIQQSPKVTHGVQKEDSGTPEPGVSRVFCENPHEASTKAKPPQAPSKMASCSGSSSKSLLVGQRSVLAPRSRAQNGASDAMLAPVTIEADAGKKCEERVRGDTVRAHFSFALGDDGRGIPNGAEWIGTQLFPTLTREDDIVDSQGSSLWEGHEGDAVEVGPTCSEARSTEESFKGAIIRRVRPRPDSWGARSSDEYKGWLGTSPRGEYWDDGDGYLKLRAFPAPEKIGGLDATVESGKEVQPTDIKCGKSSDHDDIAPLSRADRVFQVFACLQPARQGLKLDEELSVSSMPSKRSEIIGKRPMTSDAGECDEMTMDLQIHQETAHARYLSPLRQMETNVADEMGCIPRYKGAKDTRAPTPPSDANECEEPIMSSRTDEEIALARGSSRVSQVATNVVDANGCISAEIERPKIVADAAFAKAIKHDHEARNTFEKNTAYSKSVGLKICHAALSPRPNEKNPNSFLVPKPVGTSLQCHPPGETSSKHGRVGKGSRLAQASSHTTDLMSEASSPSKLGRGLVGEPGGYRVKPYAIDTRGGDRSSPSGNYASAKGDALPKQVGVVDLEAAESTSVRFPFSAQAASGAPRHASASEQHPASPCAPSRTPTPAPGVERRSTLERNTSPTSGLRSLLCQHSNSLPAEGEDIPTASVCKRKMVGSGVSQPRVEPVILLPSTSKKTTPRSRGSLNSRASSGVVRSRDVGTDANQKGNHNPRAIPGTASTGNVMDTAYQACGGRIADVAQRGSLTVVNPDHGATLRSSWSIDHSQELGKLDFGTTLGYDAVWYYPPADEDCVDVLRYHIVPHPVLAPSGGWISERGRLRNDPYIIAKVTPASIQRNSHPCRQREDLSSAMRWEENGDVPIWQTQGNGEQQPHIQTTGDTVERKPCRAAGSNRPPISPVVMERSPKPNTPSPPVDWIHSPQNSTCSEGRAAAGAPLNSVRATVGFGLSTTPSAKVLEVNDTGDKVKCPVCHRGMDHWPQAQRNQHAHNCMLKKSSAAKGQSTTSLGHTQITSRVIGSTKRSRAFAHGDDGVDQEIQPRDSPTSQQFRQCKPSRVVPSEGAVPPEPRDGSPDADRSPRQRRVSLQGVFSPKAWSPGLAGGADSRKQQQNRPRRGPYSFVEVNTSCPYRNTSDTTSDLKPQAVPTPAVKQDYWRAKETLALERRSECPICRLSFAGRQGQWERDAHIQQCLESLTLEGAFDPHE